MYFTLSEVLAFIYFHKSSQISFEQNDHLEPGSIIVSFRLPLPPQKAGAWSSWELELKLGDGGRLWSGGQGAPCFRPGQRPGLIGRICSCVSPSWAGGAASIGSVTQPGCIWTEGAFYGLLESKLGASEERALKVQANSGSFVCDLRPSCVIALTAVFSVGKHCGLHCSWNRPRSVG